MGWDNEDVSGWENYKLANCHNCDNLFFYREVLEAKFGLRGAL
jgi:hypothetical protein